MLWGEILLLRSQVVLVRLTDHAIPQIYHALPIQHTFPKCFLFQVNSHFIATIQLIHIRNVKDEYGMLTYASFQIIKLKCFIFTKLLAVHLIMPNAYKSTIAKTNSSIQVSTIFINKI